MFRHVASMEVSGGKNLGDAGDDSHNYADAEENSAVLGKAMFQNIKCAYCAHHERGGNDRA